MFTGIVEEIGHVQHIVIGSTVSHLTIAARTVLPVIGVPLDGSPLLGLDALLATVQMPPGVPVATVAVGSAGAKNAGFLAAQILALSNPELDARLKARRVQSAAKT